MNQSVTLLLGMFTAVSILQLVQAGKIKLTDPLGTYITDYPNQDGATKVTIHQLLTHTGGTGDTFGPQYNAHRLDLRTLNDYVALYGKRAPAFEPGSGRRAEAPGFRIRRRCLTAGPRPAVATPPWATCRNSPMR